MSFRLSRRGLLIGAAAGGGLLVAWSLTEPRYAPPLAPGRDEVAFDAWLKIATDGVVTVAVPQLEMGQGVTTLLSQVVAVELGADWRQIAVEPAPLSGAYANVPLAARWAPMWMPFAPALADSPNGFLARRFAQATEFSATADGTSLDAYETPCRAAAASARALLAMAAADRWGVDWEECEVADGWVRHGNNRLSFGALAGDAVRYDPLDPPPLRAQPASERPLIAAGEADIKYPRLDLPSKVDGSYLFAGDVRLPGLVYASIRHGPIDEPELVEIDEDAVKGLPGYAGTVRQPRWVAAVAESWWTAEKALELLSPVFRTQRKLEGETIEQALETALAEGDATRMASKGFADQGLEKPDFTARYDVASAFHGTLETASATARLRDGKLELWIASQAPGHARSAAAAALGLSERDVILYPMPAGGSFDRRLEHDHAVEAALIAAEIRRPVQLIWTRWQEMLMDRPRPPVAAKMSALLLAEGNIASWHARIACPPTAKEFGRRLFGGGESWEAIDDSEGEDDPLAVEGAVPVYAITNLAVDHVPARIGLPTGRMRGNAHGYTAFFTESFIDEIAFTHHREPLSFRMQMLGEDLRMAACLQHAARLAQWGGGADQSGQGLACHRIGDGRIAAVATATQGENGVIVSRIAAAVDIGRIVNLDIARQQIEGGLLYGVDLALGSGAGYANGLPVQAGLAALGLPPLAEAPEITVEFIASNAGPADPGELGVAVAGPAIANALFSATGLRFRRLPLLSGGL